MGIRQQTNEGHVKFKMNCKCFSCGVEWEDIMIKPKPINTFIPLQYQYCPECLEKMKERMENESHNQRRQS